MRLSSIRLSGFKSFVDNTAVQFPSQLVGIVGPNGCGKSNIIDAVRWVLGESSAKNLRGEQISDVIFNGSNTRPASSQASIELNFENARGKLKGDFTKYNEISVRRKVNNEGVSTYYINNIRCRRKDVIDTFLGTGLGPRSYSIIQQGTISRLVEAKPEELRQYLEEAAGISHYKERRRETESRMQATRENLERLVDLSDELEKRLRQLSTQAKNAQTHKELKQQYTTLTQQLFALQWRSLDNNAQRLESQQQKAHNTLESHIVKIRTIEATQEEQAKHKHSFQEEYDQAQRAYYAAKEHIARAREQIQNHEQRLEEMQQEQEELTKRQQQLLSQQASDQAESSDLHTRISDRTETLKQENVQLNSKQAEYLNIEKDHNALQQQWDVFQSQSYDQRKQSELDQYKIQQIEQQIEQTTEQLKQHLDDNTIGEIARLDSQHKEQQQQIHLLTDTIVAEQQTFDQSKQDVQQHEQVSQQHQQQLHELQRQLQITEGTIASLTTLLERKTKTGNTERLVQLRKQHATSRWLDRVHVQSGWEQAIETAIPELIDMDISDDDQLIASHYIDIEQATASVIVDRQQTSHDDRPIAQLYQCSEIIKGPTPDWMQSIFFADTYQQALSQINQLAPHQRIICKNGTSLGSNWMIAKPEADGDPLLIIRQRLRDNQDKQQQLNEQIGQQQQLLQQCRDDIAASKRTSDEQQQLVHSLQQQKTTCQAALQTIQHKSDHLQQTHKQNIEHKQQLTNSRTHAEKELGQARERWSKGLEALKYDDQKRQELSDRRSFLQKQRSQMQTSFSQLQHQVGEIRLTLQQETSKNEHLTSNLKRREQDLNELHTRLQKITDQQQQSSMQPRNLHQELQKLLDQQLELEKHMQQRHAAVSEQEQLIIKTSNQYKELTQTLEKHKERTQELKLKYTEIATRKQTINEQLEGVDPKTIAEALPENADASGWKHQIQSIDRKIQVLGEVNHAAIKDFESEKERKEHLDEQRTEIEKALAILEHTISTIDKATRQTFRETFEQVNINLQQLFPKLLGGGTVKLEMTSNDLLTTGVTIIARPPGKRNTSISMLSGGEKAMTAIALVFAIFQLNPAPFCMLDEVDAPLDDINTQRYINTVKAMAEKVQFILITHSKITMEQVDQLLGITMSEAGVSRVVSVDINNTIA